MRAGRPWRAPPFGRLSLYRRPSASANAFKASTANRTYLRRIQPHLPSPTAPREQRATRDCRSARRVSQGGVGALLAGLVGGSAPEVGAAGCGSGGAVGGGFRPLGGVQAVWSRCRWSFRRLWVAVRSRHSDLAADLPRREKRWNPRLCLICAKTGSTMPWRLRYSCAPASVARM